MIKHFKILIISFWLLSAITNLISAQIKPGINSAADLTFYKIDTVLQNVLIDKDFYSIKILQKSDSAIDINNDNITLLVITETKTGKIKYKKQFNENKFNFFKIKNDNISLPGKLFLELIQDGGGSGYSGQCFLVTNNTGNISLEPVYSFFELSLVYFKSEDEIIMLDGIWNFKQDEAHFSDHRFEITRYSYTNKKFAAIRLGKTKFKYSGFDEDLSPKKVLSIIKKKEPLLLKSVNLQ